MATVSPPAAPAAAAAAAADQAADLLQNLSLDAKPKTIEVSESNKKRGSVDGGRGNGAFQTSDRSTTPVIPDFSDPTMCYLPNGYPSTAYYYGGYDGSVNEWEDYRYMNPDGVEMPTGVYGDNGSLLYHGYGYAPYGSYSHAGSPVPTIGHDGQLYGPQHYQYPTPFYQSPTPPGGPYVPNQASTSQGEISTTVPADQGPLSVEVPNVNGNSKVSGNNNGSLSKPNHLNSALKANGSYVRGLLPGGLAGSVPQDARYGFDGAQSPVPWLDGSAFPNGQPRPVTSTSFSSTVSRMPPGRNQNVRPVPNVMGLQPPRPTPGMGSTPGFFNRLYPNNRMYSQYGSTTRNGSGYGSNGYNSRTGGVGWFSVDNKYKPKGRGNGFFGYGNENMDGLNELNRGPRARGFKNQKGFVPVTLAVKGQIIPSNVNSNEKDNASGVPDREQYNKADFPVNHSDARFFIIKSYSEDDVHKSIKYSVWASTPNGNKKLDSGYQAAQETSGGCPVFLFFSVNTSGQFVGLAEMVGPVDFNKTVEYWQQDKWNGCFPVKWHIVKDVPNNLLKHIILENNDNKPVTNSRDTQEVKLEQGLQMLKIFKEHSCKTSILDDFGFYEARQKTLQEKRAKQQLQKQVWDGKAGDAPVSDENGKEGTLGKLGSLKSLDVVASLPKEPVVVGAQANGEHKQQNCDDSKIVGVAATNAPANEVVTEKRTVVHVLSNGC